MPCNSPNHLANTAVHICQLIWYISQQMFISVNICLYTCICVRICAFTAYILNQGVYDQYWSLYAIGAHPCGQRRRLLAVSSWYMQYGQIWARYVYVRICSNLWWWYKRNTARYKQIQTDINIEKNSFRLESVHIKSISVYILSISGAYTCISRVNDVYMSKYQHQEGKKFYIHII